MTDLDTLSREIAATSDAWIVPGVEALRDLGEPLRVCRVAPDAVLGLSATTAHLVREDKRGIRPNLRDLVTVNSLLGSGEAWDFGDLDCQWVACLDGMDSKRAATRTEVIARAWIAAHRGEK